MKTYIVIAVYVTYFGNKTIKYDIGFVMRINTNDLIRRVYEHKNKLVKGFSNKYNIVKLVYFETY